MSGTKQWPELVGKTFEQASQAILSFNSDLNPYNATNGVEDRMYDPQRVVCVTNDHGVVTQAPHYTPRD